MVLTPAITDNLHFLIAEVKTHLAHLQNFFAQGKVAHAHRLLERSGHAYNLNLRVQNACMKHVALQSNQHSMSYRAVSRIASELERIAELARECLQQMNFLHSGARLDLSVYLPLLQKVDKSIDLISRALKDRDTQLALKLGKTERKLEKSYKKLVSQYTRQLKKKKHTEDLVSGLFIAHAIEQMGDALLNISDSIISGHMGQPLDLQRYSSLRSTINNWLEEDLAAQLRVTPLAETRSGSGISTIDNPTDEQWQRLVYKDGSKRKLKEELEGVNRWHDIYPGVAPHIHTYQKQGDNAALLIEHLNGETFEQLVIKSPQKRRKKAMTSLKKTLNSIWQQTYTDQPNPANFMAQTLKRLPDVYSVHPDFQHERQSLGSYKIESFDALVKKVQKKEEKLGAPFSVFIHGDFNVDNIIYDPVENKINFIDLHRSCHMDYVQDVSVFMVSNYRLQVLDEPVRRRIRQQVEQFYSIVQTFARKHNDDTFEVRLALGLARSFVTSTRFILDHTMATRMYLKARYLLEQVNQLPRHKLTDYHVPLTELFCD
ncbi:PhoU domain-containing protein [Gilvimarinus sp. DA14]|uniref:PhoU domain-containing protein n=1 Tax=Gilvimarinus sp. DA14 TaxID=2956798 RepID=UPI0020B66E6E|nr:PhoU domain-containing protein [Gilvimarinus sp. DA14]UTF59905.1 phosphotransferase [Gilvimarinus sp. DA14]